jgi:hypothetical protein
MAVGAERHHVARMIFATFGQVLDVVDVQNRLATATGLGWHTSTAGALTLATGANQDGPSSSSATWIVGTHDPVGSSWLATLVNAHQQGSIGGSGLGFRSSSRIISGGGSGRVL